MALRLLGALALAAPVRLAGAEADATSLVQTRAKAHAAEEEAKALDKEAAESKELWTVPGGLPDEPGYANEKYEVHELLEGRNKNGQWVPVIITGRGPHGDLWNIHVADEFPGYDLPNVPTQLLRRPLSEGLSDYFVDNTWLRHKGLGIKLRHNKTFGNKKEEIAHWGSLVVGKDEGDGWLKLHDGYLPMEIGGVPVLMKRERDSSPVTLPEAYTQHEEQTQKEAPQDQGKDPKLPPPLQFDQGDRVEFRTKQGDWWPAQVASRDWKFADSYNVVVYVNEFSIYPVSHVHGSRLRRTGKVKHKPVPGEPLICQKEGCVLLRVRTDEGKELLLNLGMRMKTEMIMKMACNRLKVKWEDCKVRGKFTRNGAALDGTMHLDESGLKDEDVVELKLAPIVPTTEDLVDTLLKNP